MHFRRFGTILTLYQAAKLSSGNIPSSNAVRRALPIEIGRTPDLPSQSRCAVAVRAMTAQTITAQTTIRVTGKYRLIASKLRSTPIQSECPSALKFAAAVRLVAHEHRRHLGTSSRDIVRSIRPPYGGVFFSKTQWAQRCPLVVQINHELDLANVSSCSRRIGYPTSDLHAKRS